MALTRGGAIDRRPLICWPIPCTASDAVAGTGREDQISLRAVVNPFGQALRSGSAVWDMLAEDPRRGEKELEALVDRTRAEIEEAANLGAEGILYLVYGARGLHTTPMEYGGHYLERDRELLSKLGGFLFNLVFIVGEDDAYLDFVSDLPAHAFGWDSVASGVGVEQMRSMRAGPLATNAADADIELRFGSPNVVANLELELQQSHV